VLCRCIDDVVQCQEAPQRLIECSDPARYIVLWLTHSRDLHRDSSPAGRCPENITYISSPSPPNWIRSAFQSTPHTHLIDTRPTATRSIVSISNRSRTSPRLVQNNTHQRLYLSSTRPNLLPSPLTTSLQPTFPPRLLLVTQKKPLRILLQSPFRSLHPHLRSTLHLLPHIHQYSQRQKPRFQEIQSDQRVLQAKILTTESRLHHTQRVTVRSTDLRTSWLQQEERRALSHKCNKADPRRSIHSLVNTSSVRGAEK